MDAQIGYEQLRYAVWTVSYSNQIPSGYAQNQIWADSLNEALVAKNEFAFSFRPMRKDQQVGGQYANVSCWRQHGLGFVLKTTRFNDSESTLSLER